MSGRPTGRCSRQRREGYRPSQRQRKRIVQIFLSLKTIGLMRKTRHRGSAEPGWVFAGWSCSPWRPRTQSVCGSGYRQQPERGREERSLESPAIEPRCAGRESAAQEFYCGNLLVPV